MDINPQNNYDFDFNSNTIENNNQVSAEYFPRGQHTWSEPTLWDVDSEGASGNLLPCKGHVDGVRSLQDGNIGAPENTVAFVLQDNLHCIPPTVWIHNDDAYISSTRPWWTDRPTTGLSDTDGRMWLSLEQIQTEHYNWGGIQVRVDDNIEEEL